MAKASFKLSIYPNNVAMLSFVGTLDGMIINKAINDCIDKKCVHIIVNLDSVAYTNSMFLSSFIGLKTTVEKKSGCIVFTKPPKNILIILTLIGFKDYFMFYESKQQALKALV